MKIHFEREVILEVPATKAWEILGSNYERIGDWATVIPESAPRTSNTGELEGRTCSSSYGDVKEMITSWDEEKMTYSYQADGLPAMFKKGGNVWKVTTISPNRSKVNMVLDMEMATVPGLLMGWMIKPKMSKDMDGLMDDLKHFAEKGLPHPKKLKSLTKWNKRKVKQTA